MIRRVRLKRKHGAWRIAFLRQEDCSPDDRPMTKMEPVEVSNRVYGAFEPSWRGNRVRGNHEAAGHNVLPILLLMQRIGGGNCTGSRCSQATGCFDFGFGGTLKTPSPSKTTLSPTRHSHFNRTRRPFSVSSATSTLTSTTSPILTGPRNSESGKCKPLPGRGAACR